MKVNALREEFLISGENRLPVSVLEKTGSARGVSPVVGTEPGHAAGMRSLPYGHLAQRRPAFGTHRRLFRPDGGSVPVLTGEPAAGIACASPEEAARSLPARQRPAAERAGVLPAFLCSGRGFAARAFRARFRAFCLS